MSTTPTRKPGAAPAPASPLAALVARAGGTLPAQTGVAAAAIRRRERGEVRVVLADVSSSMADRAGSRRKIDVLAQALAALPTTVPITAFASIPMPLRPGEALPEPQGGTALHLALDHVAASEPTHILVVSDGHPDDPAAALRAADRLGPVQIDVIYCGPDGDRAGLAFMQRLARGGGAAHHRSLAREPERLAPALRQALALPPR